MTNELKEYVIDQYLHTDKSVKDLCVELNISKDAIYDVTKAARASGLIPKDFVKKTYVPIKPVVHAHAGEPTLPKGKTVNCTLAVSRTCVYGCSRHNNYSNLCNYMLCTNKIRECDPDKCDRYSKISEDNPRQHWDSMSTLFGKSIKRY